MRRKHIARPSRPKSFPKRQTALAHEAVRAFNHRECRVTFVEVTDVGAKPERLDYPPSSEPQRHFLKQPDLRSVVVQFARNSPVGRRVQGSIAVQEIQAYAPHLGLPHTKQQGPPGQLER